MVANTAEQTAAIEASEYAEQLYRTMTGLTPSVNGTDSSRLAYWTAQINWEHAQVSADALQYMADNETGRKVA
jgi:hypothetical protein